MEKEMNDEQTLNAFLTLTRGLFIILFFFSSREREGGKVCTPLPALFGL
jgi:hypothetical protein